MIFKFRKDKFSDVVKVVAFLDKEGIEYEVTTDIEVALGGATTPAAVEVPVSTASETTTLDADGFDNRGPRMVPTVSPMRVTSSNKLFRVAQHDNEICSDTTCLDPTHLGAMPVGS